MNLYIAFGIGMLTIAGISGGYFIYAQNKIENLASSNAILEDANKQNINTIKQLQDSYSDIETAYNGLVTDFSKIESENKTLQTMLSEHDLGMLAATKPGLIQNRINKATANVLLCFEALSGAALTEEQLNVLAKDSTSCPGFTNP